MDPGKEDPLPNMTVTFIMENLSEKKYYREVHIIATFPLELFLDHSTC